MMQEKDKFRPIKLTVLIGVIVILVAVLALLAVRSFKTGGDNDNTRKTIANSIYSANKIYFDRNAAYAEDVGDTNPKNCAGASPTTLVGAYTINCPSLKARSGSKEVAWDGVYNRTDPSHWSLKIDLERGGTFSCDQDGCR